MNPFPLAFGPGFKLFADSYSYLFFGRRRPVKCLLLALLLIITRTAIAGEQGVDMSCEQVGILARMARAKSVSALGADRQRAGSSYRVQTIAALRVFELRPRDRVAARALIILIPSDEIQRNIWLTFGDSLCGGESLKDMVTLAQSAQTLILQLSKAVQLEPVNMDAFVSCGLEAVQYPHSDLARWMRRVCLSRHSAFAGAVGRLPVDEKVWFTEHVVDPTGCIVLALPEGK